MISPPQTGESAAPCIQLTLLPQLAEAKSKEDDWTGTTDAIARRRAQTRLNTRAYRKRKALAKKLGAFNSSIETPSEPEEIVECWDVARGSVAIVPSSRFKQQYNARKPLLSDTLRNVIFPLCSDHLITLLQYNALRASAVNRSLISGMFVSPLECGSSEEVIHIVPFPKKPEFIPPALLPTLLQQTVPHPDWIDSFPSPEGRDSLIRAVGTYDEDDLWADCIGGLFEGFPDDEIEKRGIVAWSPPWDISGWEMSEGFVKKWGWLFDNVPGIYEATNRWRIQRGEDPIEMPLRRFL